MGALDIFSVHQQKSHELLSYTARASNVCVQDSTWTRRANSAFSLTFSLHRTSCVPSVCFSLPTKLSWRGRNQRMRRQPNFDKPRLPNDADHNMSTNTSRREMSVSAFSTPCRCWCCTSDDNPPAWLSQEKRVWREGGKYREPENRVTTQRCAGRGTPQRPQKSKRRPHYAAKNVPFRDVKSGGTLIFIAREHESIRYDSALPLLEHTACP